LRCGEEEGCVVGVANWFNFCFTYFVVVLINMHYITNFKQNKRHRSFMLAGHLGPATFFRGA
jgi:hypothetical protein